MHGRSVTANILATILWAALALASPAQAQFWRSTGLPDTVEFGTRIEMGDLDAARAWLDRGLDPDFIGDRIGTGLMIAAWEGNVPMMALFVSRGADINKTNKLGEQAIMHAAWKGRAEAVQWLLARGAKLNREPRQWTALHYAAFSGHSEVVSFLVEKGADINAQSTNGSTPLMMAVYEGREAMVKQLITLGADRRIRNDYDEGAMDWAFKHNQHAIARLVGTMEEFAAAASRPKAYWPQTVRSLPVTTVSPVAQAKMAQVPRREPGGELRAEIDELLRTRNSLERAGRLKDAQLVDRRISVLRFKLAKPGEDYRRSTPVLEISASRTAPQDQKTRLIVDPPAIR
jgi:ankyrin repeat protein